MRTIAKAVLVGILLFVSAIASSGQSPTVKDMRGSLVVVFKDGHRQSFQVADITRIEFKATDIVVFRDGHQQSFPLTGVQSFEFDTATAKAFPLGRNHFVGKWRVGEGNGEDFFITLEPDGEARKSIGASHGTWTVVEGEARIAWDDGWHDAIRKVGTKHEKVAFEPGKSFSDEPTNVTEATNLNAQPI